MLELEIDNKFFSAAASFDFEQQQQPANRKVTEKNNPSVGS